MGLEHPEHSPEVEFALVLYEYPFNESIRTMLRLEHLFDRMAGLIARDTAVDARADDRLGELEEAALDDAPWVVGPEQLHEPEELARPLGVAAPVSDEANRRLHVPSLRSRGRGAARLRTRRPSAP